MDVILDAAEATAAPLPQVHLQLAEATGDRFHAERVTVGAVVVPIGTVPRDNSPIAKDAHVGR